MRRASLIEMEKFSNKKSKFNSIIRGISDMTKNIIEDSEILKQVIKERPVGTENNEMIVNYLEKEFLNSGYAIKSMPFDCIVWKNGESKLKIGNDKISIFASPFSTQFYGEGKVVIIKSIKDLQEKNLSDKIIVLCKEIAKRQLQPKDFPFYYPDEDKKIISCLEEQNPKAIISVTGQSQMCGRSPFPMFEDGNFSIPSAYVSDDVLSQLVNCENKNTVVSITINSQNIDSKSRQIVGYKKVPKSKGKIIVCAHMDTKYNTVGALDNATGIAVLMKVMYILQEIFGEFDIDFVPFNSEEYFGVDGELNYLDYIDNQQDKIELVINIDSPCHINSKTAISCYNLSKNMESHVDSMITKYDRVVKGDEWYAGDHCAFVFRGIPCIAVASSNLFEGALEFTHTPKDTLDTVDLTLINHTAEFISEFIQRLG
ncbi:M28 family metallopeptidase [Clostridioides difficile]